ncbi:MAG: winged helix-turn-helix transcriptional regulator [Candidatus Bathyarchaeota archaeon]|nr:winged helix-turn-helix transcriptional regulator [Candidatus Bathyarchaeota archaeon]
MSLKRAVTAFVLSAIVLGSFAALLYQQKNFAFSVSEQSPCLVHVYSGVPSLRSIQPDNFCLLAIPVPATTFCHAGQLPVSNSTRAEIYSYIKDNPGVQFRGICSGLGISVGLAQYHLGVLVKSGLVSFLRDGRYKRFFVSKKFSRKEMLMISLLRHKTARKILETLLRKKRLSHGELAGEVAITSQALTWQMHMLEKTELVQQANEGIKTVYSLNEAALPMLKQCLALTSENST